MKDLNQLKILFSEKEVMDKVKELAEKINNYYSPITDEIVAVCVLKGSVHFFSDLMKHIKLKTVYNFIQVSSYSGETTTGRIKVKTWVEGSLEGKHVIIVEDIVDTGNTLRFIIKYLKKQNPASLKIVSLIVKDVHEHGINVDFDGFHIGNVFVVGYGLDYDEYHRNLPFIGYFEN